MIHRQKTCGENVIGGTVFESSLSATRYLHLTVPRKKMWVMLSAKAGVQYSPRDLDSRFRALALS
jgi:hypothetical protein